MFDGRGDFVGTGAGWRMHPGRSSLNRGLVALAVTAAGYLIGFAFPLAFSSSSSRAMFVPVGGILALFFAAMAIAAGLKVRKFLAELTGLRRDRVSALMDIDAESRLAAAAIALGIICIVVNPLIVFAVLSIV